MDTDEAAGRWRMSVVIPTFNAANTLARAIHSARAQTLRPDELIVVDDGSSDETARILESLAGPDLRVLRNLAPTGASAARNRGIEAATGELVAFLDADDEWAPAKLERQVAALRRNPAAVFCACGSRFILLDGRQQDDLYAGVPKVRGAGAWRALLACNFVATPSVLARRDALIRAGLFDKFLKVAEDQDMWIKLALAGELEYVDQPLVTVYQQPSSLSAGQRIAFARAYTLPMLERHLDRVGKRLGAGERRAILAERYARIGRGAFAEAPRQALVFLLKGSLLGYQPLTNLAFVVAASKPGRWLKRLLRQGAA